MPKSTFSKIDVFDEEVIFCLEHQMIPAWKQYGMDHLAVATGTLREFHDQPLPEQMRTWKKKRTGKRVVKRQEVHGASGVVEAWPEDKQQSMRFPRLLYVRGGQADIRVADYVIQFPQEHFLLVRPGIAFPTGEEPFLEEPHAGKSCETWHFVSTSLNHHVALFVHISEGEKGYNNGHYYIVSDDRVSQLFHFFTEETLDTSPGDRETAFVLMHAFLRLFLREIKENRFHDRGPAVAGISLPAHTASPIEIARQYVVRNLNHHLTIDSVARVVFMSRTDFIRQFREETGQTFHEYLSACRLEEAKHWLLRKDCSIEVVCQFVGLKSTRFHKFFQQHTGMTPSEFRRQNKTTR